MLDSSSSMLKKAGTNYYSVGGLVKATITFHY